MGHYHLHSLSPEARPVVGVVLKCAATGCHPAHAGARPGRGAPRAPTAEHAPLTSPAGRRQVGRPSRRDLTRTLTRTLTLTLTGRSAAHLAETFVFAYLGMDLVAPHGAVDDMMSDTPQVRRRCVTVDDMMAQRRVLHVTATWPPRDAGDPRGRNSRRHAHLLRRLRRLRRPARARARRPASYPPRQPLPRQETLPGAEGALTR